MIIGINGKIGSGKDTIGNMIQCLMNHPSISNSDLLYMINNDIVSKTSKCKIKKFAGKLKTTASLLTGIPVEMFEDQEFKKLDMNPEWGMTYREFLQKLGTEAMRDGLHTNVWCNALFSDYTPIVKEWDELGNDTLVEYPNWIITDMRFPNEMEAVKEKKGITILVQRPCQECGITVSHSHICSKKGETLHASETGLDDSEFDYYISNDGTLEDLIEKVKEILIKENII